MKRLVLCYRVVFGHANKCREKPSTSRSSRVPALVVPDTKNNRKIDSRKVAEQKMQWARQIPIELCKLVGDAGIESPLETTAMSRGVVLECHRLWKLGTQ